MKKEQKKVEAIEKDFLTDGQKQAVKVLCSVATLAQSKGLLSFQDAAVVIQAMGQFDISEN